MENGEGQGKGSHPEWFLLNHSVVKNPPANAGDMGAISDLGRSHVLQSSKACAPASTEPAL